MDRLVSLGVGTKDAEDFSQTFQDLSELARNLGVNHDYVNVTASGVKVDSDEEPSDEELYYDEDTLVKVREAVFKACQSSFAVDEIVNNLLNAGILFRERRP